ncbi:HAD-IIIA family hydrolase [Nanoarchaeota archaeon]
MNEIIMTVGLAASGKSSISKEYISKGYSHLNRDSLSKGARTLDLLPLLEKELKNKNNVILDNTHITADKRIPFIQVAKKYNTPIHCVHMTTSKDDAQINALTRMYQRYEKIFYTKEEIKEANLDDPNIFPISALFSMNKRLQKPSKDEGFDSVRKQKFIRRPYNYNNKALILDYDGTLRKVTGDYKYPTKPSELEIMPNRKETLQHYKDQGYKLFGVSNQSGIEKGILTEQDAIDCFEATNKQLEQEIDYHYCKHYRFPQECYCRKPQSGFAVYLIEKHQLDPNQTFMVGDMTTDKTWANRLGMEFVHEKDFF